MNDGSDFKTDKLAAKCCRISDEQIASNSLFKIGIATTEGVYHFLPGVFIAVAQDAEHPDAVAKSVLVYATCGIAMRAVLPKLAAARLLIAGILALRASEDTAVPFADAYRKAYRAQNLNAVISAGNELGNALGHFAVDSAIGIAAGGISQKFADSSLLAGLGHRSYLHFEYNKSALWSYVPLKGCMENSLKQLTHIFPAAHSIQLTLDEKLNRICNVGESVSSQIESERFYRYGPLTGTGVHTGFSDYLDKVMKKTPVQNSDSGKQSSSDLGEFSFENMSTLADAVRNCMSGFSNKEVQLLDLKERLKAPIFSVSDKSRSGSLLQAKFQHSCRQLCDLITGIKNQSQLNNLLYILDLHARSAIQDELKLANTNHLNVFAKELHKTFTDGIKKAGISNQVLLGSAPSAVAITDDHGYVNFTIPSIPGVIDRPVTVFPRNQVELESVMAGVNRHEMIGHDYVGGDLKGFASELKEVVLPKAVKQAMQENKVKDCKVEVPGLGSMKKSSFFLKVLQAQANENISDLAGTATGGADTALSLGLLLQSLRRDSKLETASFISSRFEDHIEPHGIDRCRIKWCAEQMRQLAPHNAEILKQARALDSYAATASRSGRYYIWANADTEGQIAIPIKEWDSLVPHIVKAQLMTPLESLEGKRLKDILPDMAQTTAKIEALTAIMQHDLMSNRQILPSMFNPTQYSIGEVYAAGLRCWMSMTAQGVDAYESLAQISRLSNKLCDLYLKRFR